MKRAKILIIGLLTVVLLAGLVLSLGCAKPAEEEEKLLIVMLMQYGPIDFFVPARIAGEDLAEEYGFDFEFRFPADYDLLEMIAMIETYLAKGEVDGLVVEAGDPASLLPIIRQVKAAGIPVVLTNELVREAAYVKEEVYDGYCGADGSTIGEFHGELVEKNLLGEGVWAKAVGFEGTGVVEGKVAYLTDLPGAMNLETRITGARDYLAQFPGIVDVGLYDGTVDMAKAKEVVTAILTAHPDLAALISVSAPGTTAAGMVIEELDLVGKVIFAGMTPSEPSLELVKSKAIASLVCQDVYAQGYLPVKALVEYLLDGVPIPKWLPGGVSIVTLENVDEVIEKGIYQKYGLE